MTSRAVLGISLLVCLAAIGCEEMDDVAGPDPAAPTPTVTPAQPPIAIAGDWVGVYQADPTRCQTSNLAAATATFAEDGATLTGNFSSTASACPIVVRVQAVRNGNTFSGTASQLGYTGTVRGRFDGPDLIVEVSTLTNATGNLTGGTAQLHRP